MIKAIFLSSVIFNLGMMLGRLSGFLRESFVAATYGVSLDADIVVLMLTVPDLLVNILMGGALGAVLVPEFSNKALQPARQLLYQAFIFFGLIFVCITSGLFYYSESLVNLLAPGFNEIQKEKSVTVLCWVLWLIPLTVLAGVSTAYLHAKNKFITAALGTLMINSSIIIGLFFVKQNENSLFILALFVLLGGLLRLLSQLMQIKISWSPWKGFFPNFLHRGLLIHYGQAMLSGSVLLLFPVIARAMASTQGDGGLALFNYATRLVEFPLVITVTFLATVFFPRLALSFAGDIKQHRSLIKYGVQITVGLSLVAATTLILLSDVYVQIVYGYGNMQTSSLLKVESLVVIGLLGLPLQGLVVFFTAIFNARKNTRTPLIINGVGLVFFLACNQFSVFGQGLSSVMWGMIASYGLIWILQLILLKIEQSSWWQIFFDKTFFAGIICTGILFVAAHYGMNKVSLSIWVSSIIICLIASFSLTIMIVLNKYVRTEIKRKLKLE